MVFLSSTTIPRLASRFNRNLRIGLVVCFAAAAVSFAAVVQLERERETHPVRSWHPLLNNSRVMDRQTVKINGRANLPNPPVIPTTDDDVRSTHYDYTHTRLLAAPRLPP